VLLPPDGASWFDGRDPIPAWQPSWGDQREARRSPQGSLLSFGLLLVELLLDLLLGVRGVLPIVGGGLRGAVYLGFAVVRKRVARVGESLVKLWVHLPGGYEVRGRPGVGTSGEILLEGLVEVEPDRLRSDVACDRSARAGTAQRQPSGAGAGDVLSKRLGVCVRRGGRRRVRDEVLRLN
jgi:hypothetical protein